MGWGWGRGGSGEVEVESEVERGVESAGGGGKEMRWERAMDRAALGPPARLGGDN